MRPECTNHITCTTVDGASEMDDGLVERRQDKLHVGQNILLVGQNKLHVGQNKLLHRVTRLSLTAEYCRIE